MRIKNIKILKKSNAKFKFFRLPNMILIFIIRVVQKLFFLFILV